MGIPIEYSVLFMMIVFVLTIFSGLMIFINPDLNRCVFAMILLSINIIFSYLTAYSLFVVNIYGFTSSGVLVENNISDWYIIGYLFVVFAYISLALSFYAIALCYKKPWEATLKSYRKRSEWYEEL